MRSAGDALCGPRKYSHPMGTEALVGHHDGQIGVSRTERGAGEEGDVGSPQPIFTAWPRFAVDPFGVWDLAAAGAQWEDGTKPAGNLFSEPLSVALARDELPGQLSPTGGRYKPMATGASARPGRKVQDGH